ncbi:MAG: hypothetical protein H0V25_12435 [Solirubrobacterales bacterium]|nr:hypothetical protein [Solirubrobacterales bacterium]
MIALCQLVALGLGARAARKRVAAGRLHGIYRGVFAVGHRNLTRQGWWMAAVLAGNEGAVLSHRPGGSAWNLRPWNGPPAITVPTWRRGPTGVEVHSSSLPADEVTVHDGIPITSVARTILDLATLLDRHALARVVEEAEFQRLSGPLSLPEIVERHRGERGVGRLRAVLEASGYGKGVTKLELEELFVRFLAEQGLPHPELNASLQIGERFYRPDGLWRAQRLIVELHSATFHGTAPAVTRDASRDRRLLMAGWRVIHVTWAQLHDAAERLALAADLRMMLGSATRNR